MQKISAGVSRILILLVHGYRWLIGPLFGRTCRFHPSCSQYAIEALTTHGAARGVCLTFARVARCHPWHPGGFDPVPPLHQRNPPQYG